MLSTHCFKKKSLSSLMQDDTHTNTCFYSVNLPESISFKRFVSFRFKCICKFYVLMCMLIYFFQTGQWRRLNIYSIFARKAPLPHATFLFRWVTKVKTIVILMVDPVMAHLVLNACNVNVKKILLKVGRSIFLKIDRVIG